MYLYHSSFKEDTLNLSYVIFLCSNFNISPSNNKMILRIYMYLNTLKSSVSCLLVETIIMIVVKTLGFYSVFLGPLFVCFLYPAPPEGGILFYLCQSFRPSKIFFIAFFLATIDGKNLIFGHKL